MYSIKQMCLSIPGTFIYIHSPVQQHLDDMCVAFRPGTVCFLYLFLKVEGQHHSTVETITAVYLLVCCSPHRSSNSFIRVLDHTFLFDGSS